MCSCALEWLRELRGREGVGAGASEGDVNLSTCTVCTAFDAVFSVIDILLNGLCVMVMVIRLRLQLSEVSELV